MQIWKYEINAYTDGIMMPEGAKPLSVDTQGDAVCMWVLVDPLAPMGERSFSVHGTGWDIDGDPGRFIGTFQLSAGLVFHLFETPSA